MAEIVLGMATSHSPQVNTVWEHWKHLRGTNDISPGVPSDLDAQLQPDVLASRFRSVQQAVKTLGEVLRAAAPLDAIVLFGDDQHEEFNDNNMPAIAVYHGEGVPITPQNINPRNWTGPAEEFNQLSALVEPVRELYPNASELATYLVGALTEAEFDIARCNSVRPEGIGHAFAFLYRRLWPECDVPIVPIMINTYYPPNVPSPKRCYALGAAVRNALEAWPGGKRVAVIASGGLSHIVLDEAIDHMVLDGLRDHSPEQLYKVPMARLRGGTSEVLTWIALGGAVGPMPMTLLEYVPGYRTKPSTGVGMAFAYWKAP